LFSLPGFGISILKITLFNDIVKQKQDFHIWGFLVILQLYMSKKRMFFIVDDDTDDQELFIEAINEIDNTIQCLSASDCEEALDKLKNGKMALPDMIFLDLNMPRLNGKQCLAELKKLAHLRHIPVIIYSTSSEKKDIEETARLGAAHFLTKPNKFDDLCKALKFVMSKDWKLIS
jgi:CheY-like chemotaxis protein